MKLSQELACYTKAFLRLLYPASCAVCGLFLEALEEDCGLCLACQEELEDLLLPVPERSLARRFEFLDEAWALFPYEAPVKEILAAVKFEKSRRLLRVFETTLQETALLAAGSGAYDALVPIPLERMRLAERQFNQSEILARFVSEALKIPVLRLLEKPRPTAPQNRLNAEERAVNLFRAFRAPAGKNPKLRNLLLLDDIVTTGSTAEEAARTLKAWGADRVGLLTVAQTSRKSTP